MIRSNELKEISIKNCTNYYYFDDIIIINDFNLTNIKIDTKSYKDILIFYIVYETIDGVTTLYINFNEINGYIEDDNGSKYLTLIRCMEET